MTTAKTVTVAAALLLVVHRWRWLRTVYRRAANCRWRAALMVVGMAAGIPAMAMVTRRPRYTTTPRRPTATLLRHSNAGAGLHSAVGHAFAVLGRPHSRGDCS